MSTLAKSTLLSLVLSVSIVLIVFFVLNLAISNLLMYADMGWQQKGSMRLYNSLSGISWLVGVLSKMICDVLPMCKACGTCEAEGQNAHP